VIARRLLMGGGGSFTTPNPFTKYVLTEPANGGMSPWTIRGAFHHDGVTYVGFVTGTAGDEKIVSRTDAGVINPVVTFHAGFSADAHDSPTFVVRPSDSRLIAVYSAHNSTPINLRVSTDPLDSTGIVGFGAATNLDSQLGGARYTYNQLHYLSSTDLLYLVYRDEPTAGTDSRWCLSSCAPGSPTTGWAAQTIVYRIAGDRSYIVTWDNGVDRIDFVAMENPGRVGHFYWLSGSYYKTDGTAMGSPPFDFADTQLVYNGADSWVMNIAYTVEGYPVLSGQVFEGSEFAHYYWRWTGSAWLSTFITNAGAGYVPGDGGAEHYGSAVDDVDPNVLWVIKDDGAQPELFRYETFDNGVSFSESQITSGSSGLVLRPVVVRDADDGLLVIWHYGTWDHYTDYNVGIYGLSTP
jgi:hypothetical protein